MANSSCTVIATPWPTGVAVSWLGSGLRRRLSNAMA
jgi:hypothetical protein